MSNEVRPIVAELTADAMLNEAVVYAVQEHRDGQSKGSKI